MMTSGSLYEELEEDEVYLLVSRCVSLSSGATRNARWSSSVTRRLLKASDRSRVSSRGNQIRIRMGNESFIASGCCRGLAGTTGGPRLDRAESVTIISLYLLTHELGTESAAELEAPELARASTVC